MWSLDLLTSFFDCFLLFVISDYPSKHLIVPNFKYFFKIIYKKEGKCAGDVNNQGEGRKHN